MGVDSDNLAWDYLIVGPATLLLSNLQESPVRGPAQSSKDEYAAQNYKQQQQQPEAEYCG